MIDHSSTDLVLERIFTQVARSGNSKKVPDKGSLSIYISELIEDENTAFSHSKASLFGFASIEMWHRAIHSFLISIALTKCSPIWSSVIGYYASHYVMRAFAHAFGFFKSYSGKKIVQLIIDRGYFDITKLKSDDRGEHKFYWKVVKDYRDFTNNPLFSFNNERDNKSDCFHRNYANYTDLLNNFVKIELPNDKSIEDSLSKICSIKRYSITELRKDKHPDLQNIQTLAYQRIVTFHDFLNERIPDNSYWKTFKEPNWCKGIIDFYLDDNEKIKRDFD
jgi:hypothetical protein